MENAGPIFAIPSLPTTLTGKVDRQRLQEEMRAASAAANGDSGRGSAVEEELAKIWRSALRLEAWALTIHSWTWEGTRWRR